MQPGNQPSPVQCFSIGVTAVVLMTAAAGCGTSRPVMEGLVTLDGAPLDKGTIMLMPADGKGQTAGSGIIAGWYRMDVSPGPMRVQINASRKDGTMRDPLRPDSDRMIDRYIEIIPARYNEKSELEVTIKPGRNTHNFALEGSVLKSPDASPK